MNPTSPSNLTPLPEGFIASLDKLPGIDKEALTASLDTPGAVSIRLNPAKPMADDPLNPLYDGVVAWCHDGRYLRERPVFTLMPEMHGGAFYVQDASSMIHATLMEHIVRAEGERPLRVLDVCAAPGGKTTAMLSGLPADSVMVANEFSPQRVKALEENIIKFGSPNVLITCGDGAKWGEAEECFDVVAVDAPCSGEGMMRKEEVARSQWSEGLVESCARTQRDILDGAVRALRPGGWLIYSTCTFNLTEDECMVRRLVDKYGLLPALPSPEMLLSDSDQGPAAGFDPEIPALRFMPHITRGEGLFVTILRKPADDDNTVTTSSRTLATSLMTRERDRKGKDKRGKNVPPSAKGRNAGPDLESCREWITRSDGMVWLSEGESVRVMPKGVKDIAERLPKGLRPVRSGVEIARIKGHDLIPSPELALSTLLDREAFPVVDLSREDALRYLRHDALTLPADTPRGMVLITHNDVALGWMKNIGNRANNHWPAPWRIRMQ